VLLLNVRLAIRLPTRRSAAGFRLLGRVRV
jgi:hypothetical protein